MPKSKKKTDLSKKVMGQIHKKHVKMHPRLYFVLGSLLLGIGLAGAVVLATIFINLAFFRLRIHGPLGYLWFGGFGLKPFLATFPWLPLLIAIGGILSGLVLLRRYDISYKKSFLALVIGLVALVLTTGFLLDYIGLNERMERLRPLRPLYPPQFAGKDWVTGEIIEVGGDELIIVTPEEREVTIKLEKRTLLPFGGDFKEGERIRAIGKWQDDVFVAIGIGKGRLDWRMINDVGRGIEPSRPTRPF